MTRFIIVTIILCAVNISCQSPSDEISKAFKTVDNSLQKSSAHIDSANTALLKSIDNNLTGSIKEDADSLTTYIQITKKELEDYSTRKYPSKNGEPPALEDLETSNKIMIENGKAAVLFSKLKGFNQRALHCSVPKKTQTEIEKIFGDDFFKNSDEFNTLYFKNTPTVAALTMLSSFENKIKNIQNILLTFVSLNPPID